MRNKCDRVEAAGAHNGETRNAEEYATPAAASSCECRSRACRVGRTTGVLGVAQSRGRSIVLSFPGVPRGYYWVATPPEALVESLRRGAGVAEQGRLLICCTG
jgi:hypothetical protein